MKRNNTNNRIANQVSNTEIISFLGKYSSDILDKIPEVIIPNDWGIFLPHREQLKNIGVSPGSNLTKSLASQVVLKMFDPLYYDEVLLNNGIGATYVGNATTLLHLYILTFTTKEDILLSNTCSETIQLVKWRAVETIKIALELAEPINGLSIAGGFAQIASAVLRCSPDARYTLLDNSYKALELIPANERLITKQWNIFKDDVPKSLRKYNLVDMVGIADYINDKKLLLFFGKLKPFLSINATIVFGCFDNAEHEDYQWMETNGWILPYRRNQSECINLLKQAFGDNVCIEHQQRGLQHLFFVSLN